MLDLYLAFAFTLALALVLPLPLLLDRGFNFRSILFTTAVLVNMGLFRFLMIVALAFGIILDNRHVHVLVFLLDLVLDLRTLVLLHLLSLLWRGVTVL